MPPRPKIHHEIRLFRPFLAPAHLVKSAEASVDFKVGPNAQASFEKVK